MLAYAITFPLTALVVNYAGSQRIRSPWIRALLCVLAATVMATIAGARDFHVAGPDTLGYGNRVFYAAVASPDFGAFLDWTDGMWIEGDVGYFYLNYVVSRLTQSPHVFYFWLAMLNCGIALAAIMLSRRLGSTGLMWLGYLGMYFHLSFNMLRQSPAIALTILGIALVLRRRRLLGLAAGLAGMLFHSSALIFVMPWLAVCAITRSGRYSTRRVLLACVVATVAALNITVILGLWDRLVGGHFTEYLSETHRLGGGRGLIPSDAVRAIAAGAGVWVLCRMHGVKSFGTLFAGERYKTLSVDASPEWRAKALSALIALLLIEAVLIPLRPIAYPMFRMIMYFGCAAVIAYPAMVSVFRRHRLAATGAVAAVNFSPVVLGERETRTYSSEIIHNWFAAGGAGWILLVLLILSCVLIAGYSLLVSARPVGRSSGLRSVGAKWTYSRGRMPTDDGSVTLESASVGSSASLQKERREW